MRWLRFNLTSFADRESFQALISTEGISIVNTRFLIVPSYDIKGVVSRIDEIVQVLYEIESDLVEREREVLDHAKYRARMVDKVAFGDLKNQKQRELFLLDKYGISSRESQTIIELLKPEMSAILNGEVPDAGN